MNDKRGSEPQRFLYKLIKEIYPKYTIVYEQHITDIGQRFDIFIKELGIAIEYDGVQHDKYIEHFHRDMNGYIDGLRKDKNKNNWAKENGIKIVRFKGNIYSLTIEEVKTEIDNIEYPETEYDMNSVYNPIREDLRFARKVRKTRYLDNKSRNLKTYK